MKKKTPYWDRKVLTRDTHKGLAHTTMNQQRGLKGITLGPANEGRTLSSEEKAAAIKKMQEEGKL